MLRLLSTTSRFLVNRACYKLKHIQQAKRNVIVYIPRDPWDDDDEDDEDGVKKTPIRKMINDDDEEESDLTDPEDPENLFIDEVIESEAIFNYFCFILLNNRTFVILIEIEDMGSDPYPGWKQV